MDVPGEMISEIRKYLVGPRDANETLPSIPNYPTDYYVSGILFPKDTELDALDTDDLEAEESGTESKSTDGRATPKSKQSSMGLRVDIADGISKVNVDLDYARYEHAEAGWKRIPLDPRKRNHVIRLEEREGVVAIPDSDNPEAELRWVLNESVENSTPHRVLNCFLSNARRRVEYDRRKASFKSVLIENNQNTIFQPVIKIHSTKPIFRNHKPLTHGGMRTAEDRSLDLIFRDTLLFGEGSNCAADWDPSPVPLWVRTDFLPAYQSPVIRKESDDDCGRPTKIDMHKLSYAPHDDDKTYKNQIEANIRPLVAGYKAWIDEEERKIEKMGDQNDEHHVPAAKDSIRQCRDACKRMEDGLEFLLRDANKQIRLAFALANRAMLYQRLHYSYALDVSKGNAPNEKPNPTIPGKLFWYPFQAAFLIMNIRGISDASSVDRDVVDLLWFPTGGGKTEAYLAVAAFAMIYRRMQGDDEDDGLGVSVIMRYTLRLLTLQQFERASTLICAMEFIRRNNPGYGLGTSPFLIGLWVGHGLTPNTAEKSEKAIMSERYGQNSGSAEGSPVQITHCPWCGTDMTAYDYEVDKRSRWTVAHCSNKGCFFSDGDKTETRHALPILTVDTDIYKRCPSMIIATVDKFARMPYQPKAASLFGLVDRYCKLHGFLTAHAECGATARHSDAKITHIDRLDGPDLIIQDELHLITGPLGSMVGLYETAVDYLSRRRTGNTTTKPKIIASTATIRGVDDQIRKIFNRGPPQKFPPPGIRKDDSYFWWESGSHGRQYVGVSFSHRSAKYSLAKIYASLLQKAKTISNDLPTEEIDSYWTLVGYFNSKRELGGAIRLVEDDVVSNIKFITGVIHGGLHSKMRNPGKPHDGLEELTGRIGQEEIRNVRKKLDKTMDDPRCIHTLLATNMISVGIDIERLGLMVVNGQTKNSSEYIQATGRIGRRENVSGLVFTLYNPYKPRDLSHYENFIGYHSMLQRYVEPSTLTPFSVGSIERGLHAVLISMIRLSTPRLSRNESAHMFEPEDAKDMISFILDRYLEVQQINQDDDDYQYVRNYLMSFADNWTKFIRHADDAENACRVWYNNIYRPKTFSGVNDNPNVLMIDFGKKSHNKNKFPKATPDSLRNVEREVILRYWK